MLNRSMSMLNRSTSKRVLRAQFDAVPVQPGRQLLLASQSIHDI